MHQAGDVKKHLTDPTNQNSLFQVASQFNLLEMDSPAMTPERGVDIYYNESLLMIQLKVRVPRTVQTKMSELSPGYVRGTLVRSCMLCLCHWGNPLP